MKVMTSSMLGAVLALVLVGGATFFIVQKGIFAGSPSEGNARVEDGVQIVEIFAKGGYAPQVSFAKADTPTTLRVKTKGTFDCSSALTIPSLNYRKNLSATGEVDIEVPPQKAGTTLEGLCAMGMYTFSVKFQ